MVEQKVFLSLFNHRCTRFQSCQSIDRSIERGRETEREREREKGEKKWKKYSIVRNVGFPLTSKSSNLQRSFYFSRSFAFASSKIHLLSPPLFRVSRVSTRPTESFNHVREFMRNQTENKIGCASSRGMKRGRNISFLKNNLSTVD